MALEVVLISCLPDRAPTKLRTILSWCGIFAAMSTLDTLHFGFGPVLCGNSI